jgi:hypothetical protein
MYAPLLALFGALIKQKILAKTLLRLFRLLCVASLSRAVTY